VRRSSPPSHGKCVLKNAGDRKYSGLTATDSHDVGGPAGGAGKRPYNCSGSRGTAMSSQT